MLACGTGVVLTFGVHAVAPALPLIQQVFGLNDFQVGLITGAYVLPGVLVAIPFGIGADLVGRRYVFGAAALVYGVAGFLQGTAGTFEVLLLWRLLQGFAFAALMPLTVTIIGDAFSGLSQIRAQAGRQVSMAVADLVVPLIGAQLAAAAWFLPFSVQGITVVPGLLALWVLRPTGATENRLEAGYLAAAVRSIRRAGFPSVLGLAFVRFFARFTVVTFLPLHLARELSASLTVIGAVMGVAGGLGFLSALIASRVSAVIPPSRVVLGSLVAVGLALLSFSVLPSLVLMVLAAVVFALGDGFIGVLQSSYAARGSPRAVRAGLVAVNGTARNTGKLAAPLVIGAVASTVGIRTGFVVAGLFVLVAIVVVRGLAVLDAVLQDAETEPTAEPGA